MNFFEKLKPKDSKNLEVEETGEINDKKISRISFLKKAGAFSAGIALSSLAFPSVGETAENKNSSKKELITKALNENMKKYDFMIEDLKEEKDWSIELKERPTVLYDNYVSDHEELEDKLSQLIDFIEKLKEENKLLGDKIESLPSEKISGELKLFVKSMERKAEFVKRIKSVIDTINLRIEIKTKSAENSKG